MWTLTSQENLENAKLKSILPQGIYNFKFISYVIWFFKERVFIRDAFYIIYVVQLLTSGLGGGIGEDKRTRGERIRVMYNFDDVYQYTCTRVHWMLLYVGVIMQLFLPLLMFICTIMGMLTCKYEAFWHEVSVQSLIRRWP